MTPLTLHTRRCSPLVMLLALVSALATCSKPAPTPAPPQAYVPPLEANLLVISLDTTRADHLGCYGYERPTSPRIDALAADGIRFENAFTVMPTTLPSHSAMFTSLYPRQLGVLNNLDSLPDEVTTLAERLKPAGFETGAFMSARPLGHDTGFKQGFDTYEASVGPIWRADRMRNLAGQWIKEREERRFFCFVHMFDAHVPYNPPEEYARQFDAPFGTKLPGKPNAAFVQDPALIDATLREQSRNAYDAEIRFMDTEVGHLLDDLGRFGVRDRTVIVLLADHGETLDELIDEYGYAFDHGEFLYPRELRIPFVLWLPEAFTFERGRDVADGISTLDLMPTLLELLGVECLPPYEGRSLRPLLQGEPIDAMTIVSERHSFFGEPPNPWMRGSEHVVMNFPWYSVLSEGRGDELFELKADPDATSDVAPTDARRIEQMAERLERWLERKQPGDYEGRTEADEARRRELDAMGYGGGG